MKRKLEVTYDENTMKIILREKDYIEFITVSILTFIFIVGSLYGVLDEAINQLILGKLDIFSIAGRVVFSIIIITGILPLAASLPELYQVAKYGHVILLDKNDDSITINGKKTCLLSEVGRVHVRTIQALRGNDLHILYAIKSDESRMLIYKSEDFNDIYELSKNVSNYLDVMLTKK
ncbi:MAG TPA: hypothetical protein PK033_03820 [Acetivibrio sp.]|jgi:hypothetical protein|nr:hypothetical protein [Clostridium sp.]HOQ36835.1 hypothetical protein [Acetivibrio sp.]HPT90638.1 hypothetical protein [Acetivibrio sp.]HQA56988.1 hypothetical protein [Acetivibrio sp.]